MTKYGKRHRHLRPVTRMGNIPRSRTPSLYTNAAFPGHFDTYLSSPFKRYGSTPRADYEESNGQLRVTSTFYPSRNRDSHGGLDISNTSGTPLYAQANGTVVNVEKAEYPVSPSVGNKPHLRWPPDYVREGTARDDEPPPRGEGPGGRAAQDARHADWLVTPDSSGRTGQDKLDAYQAQEDAVVAAGYDLNKCGNYVKIEYDPAPDGTVYTATYCHMRDARYSPGGFEVSRNDRVERGQLIGYTGGAAAEWGSGNSSGPHLHLTLRRTAPGETSARAVDPVSHIDWYPFALKYADTSHARKYRPDGYNDALALAEVQDLATPESAEAQLAAHNPARSGENLSADPSRTPVEGRRVMTAGLGAATPAAVVAAVLGLALLYRNTSPQRFRERL